MTDIPQAFLPDPRTVPPKAPARNWWATVSLVAGCLGVLPYVPGAIAVVTGFVGVRKGRDLRIGGQRMAAVGIVLGVLSLGFWGLGHNAWDQWKASEAPRETARTFIRDITLGDRAALRSNAAYEISPLQIESWITQAQDWGLFRRFTAHSINMQEQGGFTLCDLIGTAEFSTGPRSFQISLIEVEGKWRVVSFMPQAVE